jgi:FkbM family methyltransferase
VRLTRRSRESAPTDGADSDVGRTVFGMSAQVTRFRKTTFLVPGYAAHVPVARRILGGSLVSPGLHELVRHVMLHRPGSMVHAGAFFGDMLTSFSRKTPSTVYAFEPVLENYLFSLATLEENHLDNVLLFHAGLGSENAVVQIETEHRRTGRHRGGAAYVMEPGAPHPPLNAQRIPLLTVDQFDIGDLSLIQLDVEGYEPRVLRGAERSIAANRPVVIVEDEGDRCADLLRGWSYSEVRRVGLDRVYIPDEQQQELLPVVRGEAPADRS